MSDRSALLVIDMQAGLLHGPQLPASKQTLLANVSYLIRTAHQQQAPVFFAQHTGPAGSPIEEGSALWQLAAELPRAESDRCFNKTRPSCFAGTTLLAQLQEAGVKRLVIVGMKTEYCVDTTCRAAADLGFTVVLVSDAHSTTDSGVLSAEQIIAHHNATLAGPFVTLQTAAEASVALQ
ncbi:MULTISPECIES: cysteine hydrolase family protein [unclassified Erwinia]|uniref:cysteine hydrolase family protein n=1 Tax=unclassified Erwinia TaxID=2622719 RepID=UPI0006FB7D9B|nr:MULTISPECIES: cysteine hydrolase family protein [unclassified Erwinia]KQN53786.1 isochorismatase [Erwinia sp. Leaf53]PLV62269.1 isochorismatase [Erwinia sp. B116]